MKKKFLTGSIILLIIGLAIIWVFDKGGDTASAERIVKIGSGVYTDDEIYEAMDVVEKHFRKNFEGCSLLRLEYDEGKTLSERYYCAEQYGVDRVMVLESDYYVGNYAEGCFTPDYTYKGWKWILIDEGDGWGVRTSGYG